MKSLFHLASFFLALLLFAAHLNAQDFYPNGIMKLTETSKDQSYGFEPSRKTSIKVGRIENQRPYLDALRGPNGEVVQYRRVASGWDFKLKSAPLGKGFLDQYEVYYPGLSDPLVIYLNGYEYEEPKAPFGFHFYQPDDPNALPSLPSRRLVKAELCTEETPHIAAENTHLNKKRGAMPTPESPPEFEGGVEALQKFFDTMFIFDQGAKGQSFEIQLAFLVNCNGEAGNYDLLASAPRVDNSLLLQVLERVNRMPQNWKPAIKKGKAVDCYQVLTLKVIDGAFVGVGYL
jgi:hypothetical protein